MCIIKKKVRLLVDEENTTIQEIQHRFDMLKKKVNDVVFTFNIMERLLGVMDMNVLTIYAMFYVFYKYIYHLYFKFVLHFR